MIFTSTFSSVTVKIHGTLLTAIYQVLLKLTRPNKHDTHSTSGSTATGQLRSLGPTALLRMVQFPEDIRGWSRLRACEAVHRSIVARISCESQKSNDMKLQVLTNPSHSQLKSFLNAG